MNLQHLRYFLTVMETNSITQAAERLGVTQPTLSVALKRLEREFGTALFAPDGRGIRPLPPARRLEQMLRPIIRALSDAKRDLNVAAPQRLRLGIAQSLGDPWATRLVGSYDGCIEIVEAPVGELEKLVVDGAVRIALTALPTKRKLPNRLLFREPYRLFVTPAHAFSGRRSVDITELNRQPFVLRQCCEFLGSGRQLMEAAQARVNVVAKTRQEATAAALVAAGIGCTIAPQSWHRPGLEMIAVTGLSLERRVGLVWTARDESATAHAIARALGPALSGLPISKAPM